MEVDENLKTFWNHMPPESMCNGDSYVYVAQGNKRYHWKAQSNKMILQYHTK